MPELPEVETTKNGLVKLIVNKTVTKVEIRRAKLRFDIPKHLIKTLTNKKIIAVTRQAKYILIDIDTGSLIVHLGMSGSLSVVKNNEKLEKHTHFIIYFDNDKCMRLKDPRRFGAVLWIDKGKKHKLLAKLGLEPLTDDFNGKYLYNICNNKKRSIKAIITDSHIVVGIGNIYALEALFLSAISPMSEAKSLTITRLAKLVKAIKEILQEAIKQGGTTLKDFSNVEKKAGYFAQKLAVYGRVGMPCIVCSGIIVRTIQNNRSSFYCPTCQKICN